MPCCLPACQSSKLQFIANTSANIYVTIPLIQTYLNTHKRVCVCASASVLQVKVKWSAAVRKMCF